MTLSIRPSSAKHTRLPSVIVLLLCVAPYRLDSQGTQAPTKATLVVPAWAQPGSPTHEQVPPPAGFHRPSKNFDTPTGAFDGQSDIGAALVPGSGTYDAATKRYTIRSAGYNIWYTRDEFRYIWKKYNGDASLAADATFPDPKGYDDRKVVLIIRQNLDDDSQEAMSRAEDVFGELEPALIWLRAPSDKLNGRTPLSMLRTEPGGSLVDEMLWQIEEGMYT